MPEYFYIYLQEIIGKQISKMGRGEYWHNGIKKSLKSVLSDVDEDTVSVNLSFNVDGLLLLFHRLL